ncbi:MAG: STAS domain-containing protein [Chlamydiota bacterium]
MTIGLNIVIEQSGGVQILKLEGRVDAITTPSLERELGALVETHHEKLLLDFSKVDYLSSAGMRLLLSYTKKMKGKGGVFAMCDIGEDVMEILKMAGFDKVLAFYPNEAEALKLIS